MLDDNLLELLQKHTAAIAAVASQLQLLHARLNALEERMAELERKRRPWWRS